MRSYLKTMRSKKPMAKHVFNAHFVSPRNSWTREQAQAKKGPCGATKGVEMKQSFSPKRSQQEEQAFEDELGVIPSVFYHPLLAVNSAQRLSYQLKSKG